MKYNVTDYLQSNGCDNKWANNQVATNARIIKNELRYYIISKSLIGAPEDQYTALPNKFLDKCASDVLLPHKATASE